MVAFLAALRFGAAFFLVAFFAALRFVVFLAAFFLVAFLAALRFGAAFFAALRFVALRFFGAGAAAAGAIIDIMSANIVFSCLSCWMLCGASSQASSDSRTP